MYSTIISFSNPLKVVMFNMIYIILELIFYAVFNKKFISFVFSNVYEVKQKLKIYNDCLTSKYFLCHVCRSITLNIPLLIIMRMYDVKENVELLKKKYLLNKYFLECFCVYEVLKLPKSLCKLLKFFSS